MTPLKMHNLLPKYPVGHIVSTPSPLNLGGTKVPARGFMDFCFLGGGSTAVTLGQIGFLTTLVSVMLPSSKSFQYFAILQKGKLLFDDHATQNRG